MYIVIGTDNRDARVERICFAKPCNTFEDAQAVLTTQLRAELEANDLAYWFEVRFSSKKRNHDGFVLVNYEGETIEYTIKETDNEEANA